MAPWMSHATTRRRNLVFILTDDHRYDFMSCYGHPWLQTPNLDRFVEGGISFDNAFVTTSLCSPSRASILTGTYTHFHNVRGNEDPLPPQLTTYPMLLQSAGYRTAFLGKWHMGSANDQPRPGFDDWLSFRGQGKFLNPEINHNGERRERNGYVTDILTAEAGRFIRNNRSRPFALYLSHKAVHGPFTPAPRHGGLYNDEVIPYPESMADTEENYRGKPEWLRRRRGSWHGCEGMLGKPGTFDDNYRDYCRCLAGIDDSVGEVMNTLEETGLANDTLVIYMGDNGYMWGEHGMIDKRSMHEPSMRVPMVARCPDLFEGGKRSRGLALNLDIGPTFLDAAGVPIPDSMCGRSLLGLMRTEDDWRKDFLYEYFWERSHPETPTVTGLRTDRYSYMHYHGVWGRDELYDLRNDPRQSQNLLGDVMFTHERGPLSVHIKDPELRELVAGFQARIQEIMEETGGSFEPTWRQTNV